MVLTFIMIIILLVITTIKIVLEFTPLYIAIPASIAIVIYAIFKIIESLRRMMKLVLEAESEITNSDPAGGNNDHAGYC